MLSTLQTDSFKLLFLCFFPVSHSFQYHSPVFHKTKIYHTCYILAQYHKKVSFQLYLFFQVKDNNVKMEGFIKQIKTLENQLTSLYKDSLYPRKAPLHVWRLAAKCPWPLPYKIALWAVRLALLSTEATVSSAEVSCAIAAQDLHPISMPTTVPGKSKHRYHSNSQELLLLPKLRSGMDLAESTYTSQHHTCSHCLEQYRAVSL